MNKQTLTTEEVYIFSTCGFSPQLAVSIIFRMLLWRDRKPHARKSW